MSSKSKKKRNKFEMSCPSKYDEVPQWLIDKVQECHEYWGIKDESTFKIITIDKYEKEHE